jgi:hypothetical protein
MFPRSFSLSQCPFASPPPKSALPGEAFTGTTAAPQFLSAPLLRPQLAAALVVALSAARLRGAHFEGGGRGFVPQHNDWGRYRAWEGDRFRGDFDDDWGHSFYWSHYHPGVFLNVLPPGYFQFSIGGAPYYYYGGVYYAPQQNGYMVVAPPVGAVVPALPDGVETVVAGGSMLYYADGTFYAPVANGYQVVAPPMGVIVSMLPPDATPVVINGMTYYQSNGMYYMPVMQNGVTAYETVQPGQAAVQPQVQPPVQPQVQPPIQPQDQQPVQPEVQPPVQPSPGQPP